jgi:hypothetical protein
VVYFQPGHISILFPVPRLNGASTKSFVKFAAVQETADDDQTTNIDRDRKSRD